MMSLKPLFAELYAHQDDPIGDFQKLEAFKTLSGKPEIVEKIDQYALPEVIKMICCSPTLMKCGFALKYGFVQKFYCSEKLDALKILQAVDDQNELDPKILKYADQRILNELNAYFIDLENHQKRLEADKKSLDTQLKKEIKDDLEQEELKKKKEEIKKEQQRIKKNLTSNKSCIESIRKYKRAFENGEIDKRREAAYKVLNDLDQEQENQGVFESIMAGNTLEKNQIDQFKNLNFLGSLCFFLLREENKRKAIGKLLKLYDDGIININESPVYDFLTAGSDLVLDYLLENFQRKDFNPNDENLNVLIELTLRMEYEDDSAKNRSVFCTFWNTITEEFVWSWVVKKIWKLYPDHFNSAAGKLTRGLVGKAARTYVNVLFNGTAVECKVSPAEIFSEVISRSEYTGKESLLNALRLMERNNHNLQVKLNTSERALRSQSQEIFSSLYMPLESLEELAINLSITSGNINASLVGKQLREAMTDLRTALEALNVKTVADIDCWKDLKDVSYDPNHHRLCAGESSTVSRVMFKSMGFAYVDDEGVEKERPAQVFKKKIPRGKLNAKPEEQKEKPKLKRECVRTQKWSNKKS